MGTVFKITLFVPNDKYSDDYLEQLTRKAFLSVHQVEQDMSEWIKSSPISQAAVFAGRKPVKINKEIIEVLDAALEISKNTEGAFDISFKPLGYVWDIKNSKNPPSPGEIEKARALLGFDKVILDKKNKTLYLTQQGMSIGLGGIAKGYGALKAAQVISLAGIDNFIIDAGGDLYFKGNKGDQSWVSAIKDPRLTNLHSRKYAMQSPVSMATSGDYEDYFEFQGKRYHHIIDPRTGYPAQGIRSVTVFARNPMHADAYATAFLILGYEKAMDIVKKKKNLAFVMITAENEILESENVKDFAISLAD